MKKEAVIYPIDNGWIVEYKSLHRQFHEFYKTFPELTERLEKLMDVTWLESQFTTKGEDDNEKI